MDPNKSKLEEIQKELYSHNYQRKENDFKLPPKEYNLKKNWERKEKEKTPWFKKFKLKVSLIYLTLLSLAIVFFVGSISYASFIFFRDSRIEAGENVAVNIIGPVSIGGGEKLSLDIIVQNNNSVPMELVDLVMEFPEGTKEVGDLMTDLKRARESLGEIPVGAVVRKTVNSVLFGEENSTKDIQLSIEYQIPDSNAIFQKKKDFSIKLNASPVRLTVEGLKEISSGQQIELDLKINSNSSKELKDVIIEANYPFGFTYENSSIKPTVSNNIWIFDSLKPAEEKNIKITGIIEGQNEEERFFRFHSGLVKEDSPKEIGIIFNTSSHNTIVKRSFVDLALTIDGQQREGGEVYIQSGKRSRGYIVFSNNTNNTLRDLDIKLEITGPALDEKSVIVEEGFYDSIGNVIVWNRETDRQFFEILPRKSLTLNFDFETYPLNKDSVNLRNPEIKLNATVNASRISENSVEEKVNSSEIALIKVISDVFIKAYTEYEKGPFENNGPVPPKSETNTSYTVVLDLTNSTNNLQDAKIEATIPSYVSWVNKFSPQTEQVSYDSYSRKVVWNLGDISAGTGYNSEPKKLFINLILTPSISQIGEVPNLLKNVKFSATDTFTKTVISQDLEKTPTTYINGRSTIDDHENVVE